MISGVSCIPCVYSLKLLWKLLVTCWNSMFFASFGRSSSRGISSFRVGGVFVVLKPYVSLLSPEGFWMWKSFHLRFTINFSILLARTRWYCDLLGMGMFLRDRMKWNLFILEVLVIGKEISIFLFNRRIPSSSSSSGAPTRDQRSWYDGCRDL